MGFSLVLSKPNMANSPKGNVLVRSVLCLLDQWTGNRTDQVKVFFIYDTQTLSFLGKVPSDPLKR